VTIKIYVIHRLKVLLGGRDGGGDRECQSYGAKPGTSEYIQCRVTKNAQHEQAMATVISGSEGNTGCTKFGASTVCN
jgi:hypothetical protein